LFLGFHSVVGSLGYDAVNLVNYLLTFRRNIPPYSR